MVVAASLFCASQTAYASNATTTTITQTSGGSAVTSIAAKAQLTLTATVKSGSTLVSPGIVNFCDANASYCDGTHKVGTAQLTSAGVATISIRPSLGTHNYKAVFVGTGSYTTSTSSVTPLLTVTGGKPTTTTVSASGNPGAYSLTATVTGSYFAAPTGSFGFVDTNSNYSFGIDFVTTGPTATSYNVAAANSGSSFPGSVAVGDFNNDGIPDVAAIEVGGSSSVVTIWLGDGTGNYTKSNTISPGLENIVSSTGHLNAIVVGDFNSDGKLDIAFTNYGTFDVDVCLGNGDGTFGGPIVTATPSNRYLQTLAVGDFNNDGKLDLAVGGIAGVDIELGNNAGGFSTSQSLTSVPAVDLEVADLNNDGKPDMVVANGGQFGEAIQVLGGNGNGSFNVETSNVTYDPTYLPYDTTYNVTKIALADLKGDGTFYLIFGGSSKNNAGIEVLHSNGAYSFTEAADISLNAEPDGVVSGDFNGDGIPDIAFFYESNDANIHYALGVGDGSFNSPTYATTPTFITGTEGQTPDPKAIVAVDVNGDGLTDLIIGNDYQSFLASISSDLSQSTGTLNNFGLVGTGQHTVRASYGGDGSYNISSGTISLTAEPVTPTLTVSGNPASSTYGQQVLLTTVFSPAIDQNETANGETITFYNGGTSIGTGTLSGGVATLDITSLPYGYSSITASFAGDTNFTAATSPAISYPVEYPTATTFPSVAVGSSDATQTIHINFTRTAQLGSFQVETLGVLQKDFKFDGNSSHTCSPGTTYNAGTFCSINVIFTPSAAGLRVGTAQLLENGTNDVVGTLYLSGIGTSGIGVFSAGTSSTFASVAYPNDGAFDFSGNLYVTSSTGGSIVKITPAGVPTTVATGIASPSGIGVDASGNVLYGSSNNNIYSLPGGSGTATVFHGITNPDNSIVIDGAGNVYAETNSTGNIDGYPGAGGYFDFFIGANYNVGRIIGMTSDAIGNFYFADNTNNKVYELASGASSPTLLSSGGLLSSPDGIAIDPAGNLYVANNTGTNKGSVIRLAAGSYTQSTVDTGYSASFVQLDNIGNLYVGDLTNNRVVKYTRTAAALTFASTPDETDSAQQTVSFENIGNASLAITSITGTNANYSGSSNTCTTSALASATACILGIEFAPTTTGTTVTGSVNVNDTMLGATATQTVSISGSSSLQTKTISFTQPATPAGNGQTATLVATASNGDAVTFSVLSGPATVSGKMLTYTGLGNVIVAADSAANAYAAAAIEVTHTVQVLNAKTIAFTAPATPATAGQIVALSATASNGDLVTFSITSGPATISGSSMTYTGAGTVVIAANSAATSTYAAAPTVTNTVQVLSAKTITFPALTTPNTVNQTVTLAATASNGDPVTYTITSGTATLSGTSLTYTTTGNITIAANSAQTATYGAAPTVSQTVQVLLAKTITFAQPATPATVGQSVVLSGTASNGDPVTYTIISGTAAISGSTLTYTTAGNVTIAANSAQTSTYAAAPAVSHTVQVLSAKTIAFTPLTTPVMPGQTATLVATASNGDPVTFSITSGPATISGSTLTYTSPGSVTVTANSAQTSTYGAATVSQTVTVIGTQTITFPPLPTSIVVGGTTSLNATDSNGTNVIFTATQGSAQISGNSITFNKAGTVTIAANAPATTYYAAAPTVSQTVQVLDAPTSVIAPTTPVGGTSATQTVTLKFGQATTLNSTLATAIQLVTQGTPNLDFQYVPGGTCIPGSSYAAAQTCTVFFTFKPIAAGQRPGAVQLYGNQSTPGLAAFAYIGGAATGPMMLYKPTVNNGDGPYFEEDYDDNLRTSGFTDATTDAAGNIYIARSDNNTIQKLGPANLVNYINSSTTVATTANPPAAITMDGNGTLYYLDNQGSIYSINNGASILVAQYCCGTSTLVTDLAGNLYNIYYGSFLLKIASATGAITDFRLPNGSNYQYMTIDASGNLLLAEPNEVDEITASQVSGTTYAALTPTQISTNGMLGTPSGLAVDPAGNIYYANQYTGSNNQLIKIAAGTHTQTAIQTFLTLYSTGDNIAFLKISGTGEFYIGDSTYQDLLHFGWNTPYIGVGQPDPLGSAAVGTTTISTKRYTLENDGNASAVLIAPSSLTGNAAVGGSYNTCAAGTTVAIDATCVIGFNMTPQAAGTVYDTVALTANNQGASASLFPVSVSITATKAAQTITFPNPTPLVNGTTATLTATASSGLPVSYAVTSGPATVSGSTLTLTGAGTVMVTAAQAGNANYNAATSVPISITVSKGTPVITWVPTLRIRSGVAIGTGPLDATANTPGTFTYTATLLGGSPAAITSTSTLPAGTYSLTAAFAPNDTTDYLSNTATLPFTVTGATIFIASSAGAVASIFDTGALASAATSGGGKGAAVDATGSVWSINSNGTSLSTFTPAGALGATYSPAGITAASALAIDGNSSVIVANGNGTLSVVSNAGVAVSTTAGSTTSAPSSVAIDSSGNIWVANPTANTVDEVIGGAAPAAPLANAVQTATPGVKP